MVAFPLKKRQTLRSRLHSPLLRIIKAATLVGLLHGCVPATLSGYQPTGPGTLESGYCLAGIRDVLRIQADGNVEIRVRADQDSFDNTIGLRIHFLVPEGATVQLASPEFVVQSPEWGGPQILPVQEITRLRSYYGPTEKLYGTSEDFKYFSLWFIRGKSGRTPLSKAETFSLEFPPLRINDRLYRPDIINFHAYKELGMYTCFFQ